MFLPVKQMTSALSEAGFVDVKVREVKMVLGDWKQGMFRRVALLIVQNLICKRREWQC